jgi:halimadienyl-diphosphate synthase
MPEWYEELKALFKDQIGKGEMAGTAYDTAWVASIPDLEQPDRPAFPQALDWLRLHQHSDGSWGAETEYYHDRVLSTLVACIVLAEWRRDEWADFQIEAGLKSIWRNATSLQRDPNDLVGFELILPTLLQRARTLGFRLPYSHFDLYQVQRTRKLELIPQTLLYSRNVTSTFSLEFLGDQADRSRLEGDLQEDNGSIASSPSATSYFLRQTRNGQAMAYIDTLVHRVKGAIPAAIPIDIFERAWTLYNLYLVENRFPPEALGCIDELAERWTRQGVGFGTFSSVQDLDDTSLTFDMLVRAGKQPDPSVLQLFELEDHFMCQAYERNPSISAHVHLLDALGASPRFPGWQRMVDKTVSFLEHSKTYGTFWFDKWHCSPYYTTSHAIIAALDIAPLLVQEAIPWLIQTQRPNGGWGYLDDTAEETAHSLQALLVYHRKGGRVPPQVFAQAVNYLERSVERQNAHYRALWLCKALYSPTWIVHSTILGALAMAQAL